MRRIGDLVTLTRYWWWGLPEPTAGDLLRTRTGRRYMVVEVRGKRLDCIVVGPGHQATGRIFDWTWARRGTKDRRSA